MEPSKVFISSTKGRDLQQVVDELLDRCNVDQVVHPGALVVIKPNFGCADLERLYCNTSLAVVEAVCRRLLKRTDRIVIGESDGMRDSADKAFQAMGADKMAKRLGVKLVNFSRDELVPLPNETLGTWYLSRTLLNADVFITLPIMKTHPRSVLTGALKNQWGCLPQHDRIILHKHLSRLLVDVHKVKKPGICLMDAVEAMEGRGPSNGQMVRLDLLLASTDPVALDATAMRLGGLDPYRSAVAMLAAREGVGHLDEKDIEVTSPVSLPVRRLRPAEMDWAMRLLDMVSSSRFLTPHVILNDTLFYPARWAVNVVRRTLAFATGKSTP